MQTSSVLALLAFAGVQGFQAPTAVRTPTRTHASSATSLAAKKIVLCFDGTGNEPDQYGEPIIDKKQGKEPISTKTITNPLKIHLLAGGQIDNANNHVEGQHCIYLRGVGTRPALTPIGWLAFQGQNTLNQIMGILRRQINDAKRRLADVYEEGDELYVFGFSRGSASARKFCSEIDKDGLKMKNGKVVKSPKVQFLGCFDTVADQTLIDWPTMLWDSLTGRLPTGEKLGEQDGKIAPNVAKALHLVSLDDNRYRKGEVLPFAPTLMGAEPERVEEIWFPGQHGDVGGYSAKKGLSDCALRFMMKRASENGLTFVNPKEVTEEALTCPKHEHPEGFITTTDLEIEPDATGDNIPTNFDSFRPVVAFKNNKILNGTPVKIHESVFQRIQGRSSYRPNPLLWQAMIEMAL